MVSKMHEKDTPLGRRRDCLLARDSLSATQLSTMGKWDLPCNALFGD